MNKTMTAAMTAAVLAAPALPSGKRYISDVWASHEELLEAARAGVVELSRCDLPACYDADKVAASEMTHMNATFHFVRLA